MFLETLIVIGDIRKKSKKKQIHLISAHQTTERMVVYVKSLAIHEPANFNKY